MRTLEGLVLLTSAVGFSLLCCGRAKAPETPDFKNRDSQAQVQPIIPQPQKVETVFMTPDLESANQQVLQIPETILGTQQYNQGAYTPELLAYQLQSQFSNFKALLGSPSFQINDFMLKDQGFRVFYGGSSIDTINLYFLERRSRQIRDSLSHLDFDSTTFESIATRMSYRDSSKQYLVSLVSFASNSGILNFGDLRFSQGGRIVPMSTKNNVVFGGNSGPEYGNVAFDFFNPLYAGQSSVHVSPSSSVTFLATLEIGERGRKPGLYELDPENPSDILLVDDNGKSINLGSLPVLLNSSKMQRR